MNSDMVWIFLPLQMQYVIKGQPPLNKSFDILLIQRWLTLSGVVPDYNLLHFSLNLVEFLLRSSSCPSSVPAQSWVRKRETNEVAWTKPNTIPEWREVCNLISCWAQIFKTFCQSFECRGRIIPLLFSDYLSDVYYFSKLGHYKNRSYRKVNHRSK